MTAVKARDSPDLVRACPPRHEAFPRTPALGVNHPRPPVSWPLRCLVGGLPLAVAACTPQYLGEDQIDLVMTVSDPARDFSALRSYALPSRLVDLCVASAVAPPGDPAMGGAGGADGSDQVEVDDEDCLPARHELDVALLGVIREQMNEWGYREVEDLAAETPDVVLLGGIVTERFLNSRDGVPFCDASPLYRVCWEVAALPLRIPRGSVLLELVLTDESKQGTLKSAWSAVLGNLLDEAVEEADVISRVEQAFAQSPALEEGGAP